MGEPIYISLQLAGYEGDAHNLVNQVLTPRAQKSKKSLVWELEKQAEEDASLAKAIDAIPSEIMQLIHHPRKYTGKAEAKSQEVAEWALNQISN
jgi:adenylosuccinate lyase